MLRSAKLPTYLHGCQELTSNVDSFHACEKYGTSKLATKENEIHVLSGKSDGQGANPQPWPANVCKDLIQICAG